MRTRRLNLSEPWLPPAIALACGILMVGCGGSADGPERAEVYGVVKMDEKPLPNASVRFVPVDAEEGRPSFGYTDEEGYYELQYSSSTAGAMLGEHVVRISTFNAGDEDEYGGVLPPTPETVPVQYNQSSELKRTVRAGDNEFNFELSSEGEIYNPLDDPEYGLAESAN